MWERNALFMLYSSRLFEILIPRACVSYWGEKKTETS